MTRVHDALIDSGADKSLISADVIETLPAQLQTRIYELPVPFTMGVAVQGTPHILTHALQAPITMFDHTEMWQFLIVPRLSHNILIGKDFLDATKCKIIPHEHCLLFPSHLKCKSTQTEPPEQSQTPKFHIKNIKPIFKPKPSSPRPSSPRTYKQPNLQPSPQTIFAKTIRHVEIPPESTICVPISASNVNTQPVLFTPLHRVQYQHSLMLNHSIISVQDGTSHTFITNPTTCHISLRPNFPIGKLTPDFDIQEPQSVQINTCQLKRYEPGSYSQDDETYTFPNFESADIPIDPQISTLPLPSYLSDTQSMTLRRLLSYFRSAFAFEPSELGHTHLLKHDIELTDETPFRYRPYKVSYTEREEIRRQVEEMIRNGVIQEADSPFASPVLLVKKSDGTYRLVCDWRKLNDRTKKTSYPLPLISDVFDRLSGFRYLSVLDVMSAFHQVELTPRAQEYSGIVTPDGSYTYKRLGFGMCGAPHTFQRLADRVLGKLKWNTACTFLDDLAIPGKSFVDHNTGLAKVLASLINANLTLKPSKCKFAQKRVEYLGHVVSEDGIEVNPDKTKSVTDFPQPTNARKVRQFLGLAGYYRKFIRNFSKIAHPLNALLRRGKKFVWSPECETAFQELKFALSNPPVLAHYDPEAQTEVSTDACTYGIGGVLSQIINGEKRVIAYCSRSLNKAEANYFVTELECLAVVYAIEQFRQYLYGKPFQVITDHHSLCYLQSTRNPNGRLARWALRLLPYDFTIHYQDGKSHAHADALSRNPVDEAPEHETDLPDIYALSTKTSPQLQAMLSHQADDPYCQEIITHKRNCRTPTSDKYPDFQLIDGLLHKADSTIGEHLWKLVVPKSVVQSLFLAAHNDPTGGHTGFWRTLTTLRARYFWPKMDKDVRRLVANCKTCQDFARRNTPTTGPRCPLPVPDKPWQVVSIDYMGKFPVSDSGNSYVLLIVDHLTRYSEAVPVPAQTSEWSIRSILSNLIYRHGVPETLISDPATIFKSKSFRKFLDDFHITHHMTTAGCHNSNGIVEKMVDNVKHTIAKFISSDHTEWQKWLPSALFAYNSSRHLVTKQVPYHLLFGTLPRLPCETKFPTLTIPDDFNHENAQLARSTAQKNTVRFRELEKAKFDSKHPVIPYQVNDLVKLVNFSRKPGMVEKFMPTFKSPYRVIECLNPRRYLVAYCGNDATNPTPFPVNAEIMSPFNDFPEDSSSSSSYSLDILPENIPTPTSPHTPATPGEGPHISSPALPAPINPHILPLPPHDTLHPPDTPLRRSERIRNLHTPVTQKHTTPRRSTRLHNKRLNFSVCSVVSQVQWTTSTSCNSLPWVPRSTYLRQKRRSCSHPQLQVQLSPLVSPTSPTNLHHSCRLCKSLQRPLRKSVVRSTPSLLHQRRYPGATPSQSLPLQTDQRPSSKLALPERKPRSTTREAPPVDVDPAPLAVHQNPHHDAHTVAPPHHDAHAVAPLHHDAPAVAPLHPGEVALHNAGAQHESAPGPPLYESAVTASSTMEPLRVPSFVHIATAKDGCHSTGLPLHQILAPGTVAPTGGGCCVSNPATSLANKSQT